MNLTSPKTIRSIQEKFGFTFKKGLGQNFLTSYEVLSKISEAAECENGVLEIGPGFGVLTRELAEHTKKVVSVEIDERLIPVLQYTLSDCGNIKIVCGDIMKLNLAELIENEFGGKKINVAANLPYYITTPIIAKLLEDKLPLENIIVMVQKEVAERLCAREGSKSYGAVTVMCRYYTQPEIIATVPASLFVPPPKVDSAVLRLRVLDTPPVHARDEKLFFKVVKAAFSQRRKTLLNCLSCAFPMTKPELSALLESAGIAPSRRGETLSLDEFAHLSNIIHDRSE